jgi:hypothetical protein
MNISPLMHVIPAYKEQGTDPECFVTIKLRNLSEENDYVD